MLHIHTYAEAFVAFFCATGNAGGFKQPKTTGQVWQVWQVKCGSAILRATFVFNEIFMHTF